MLSLNDWALTVRVLWNLARMWPQLKDAAAPQISVPPQLSQRAAPGPHAVRVVDAEWGRATFPAAPGPLPVIVFSSGAAADGTNYGLLTQHWASHGFCVLQPVHQDSINRHRNLAAHSWLATKNVIWAIWGLALGDLEPWRERVADVSRLLDRLPQLEWELQVKLDGTRVGAGGYSYGAHGALLLGGAHFVHRRRHYNWSDGRVRCVLAISAEPGVRPMPRKAWANLKVPFFVLTGERDDDILGRGWHPKTAPARFAPGPGELCVLPGANHFAFSGRLLQAARTSQELTAQTAIFDQVKANTLLFWQSGLSGDTAGVAGVRQAPGNIPDGL